MFAIINIPAFDNFQKVKYLITKDIPASFVKFCFLADGGQSQPPRNFNGVSRRDTP